MRRSHVAIPEHGRSKFSAIMTTYQLWLPFHSTLSANREHGRNTIFLCYDHATRHLLKVLVLVDEMNQLGSFSFTFQLVVMKFYEIQSIFMSRCYFYSTVCLNITR